jgi:hypothetical protein
MSLFLVFEEGYRNIPRVKLLRQHCCSHQWTTSNIHCREICQRTYRAIPIAKLMLLASNTKRNPRLGVVRAPTERPLSGLDDAGKISGR